MQLRSKVFLGYSIEVDATGQNFAIRNERQEILRIISVDELLATLIAPPVRPDLRRSEPRVNAALRLTFTYGKGTTFEGLSNTIGGGGLFIESPSPYPVGSLLDLEIKLPYRPTEPVYASGKVVWKRTKLERTVFFPGMGIEFKRISPEDKKRIREFVHIFTKKS